MQHMDAGRLLPVLCLNCLTGFLSSFRFCYICELSTMPVLNHVSFAVLLTCYGFFSLKPPTILFSSSIQSLITFQTCVSVFVTFFFLSLFLFSLFLSNFLFFLLLLIFLGTYGPWHCHLHDFFLCAFTVSFLATLHHDVITTQHSDVNICILWFVHDLSYPWLRMCDIQSGGSSAVCADCALALINWLRVRRKGIVWAFEISGPVSFAYYAYWPLCSHTKRWRVKTLI